MRYEVNHRLIKNGKYIGQGVLNNYAMYQVNRSFPGIVPESNSIVAGEIYEVDDRVLNRLDILEGEGSLYLRCNEKISVNGTELNVFAYVWNGSVDKCTKVGKMPWNSRRG
jgi:gamma-glutamylcyclotransferase (GGCT)/AIG2-like uncharacterized protein YtfP